MAAIKKFFEKKKLDIKFKKAGSGQKLNEPQSSSRSNAKPVLVSRQADRDALSFESQRAAEAALARLQQPKAGSSTRKSQYHYDMLVEKASLTKAEQAQAAYAASNVSKPEVKDKAAVLASVYFTVPDIGPAVLSKDDIQGYIHEFLLTQLAEEPEMASALMIQTLNKDKEKVKVCVETLCKYLDNVTNNPEDEKFRKIRITNKAYKDRVASMQGTDEFLQSVGFLRQTVHVDDTTDDDFYVLPDDFAQDTDRLVSIKEVLLAAEPIRPQLYRATCVFHSSAKVNNFKIPDEFYNINPEELKKEQQIRQEAVETMGMLRTKAMRERDEMRELRKYRYTLLRIRFPNGILLQGTFRAMDKLSTLQEFIRDNVLNDWMPFVLSSGTGHKLTDENLTLAELGLSPAAVINFAWEASIQAEIAAQKGQHKEEYLKPEVMAQIQAL